jgi:hypothetical protein
MARLGQKRLELLADYTKFPPAKLAKLRALIPDSDSGLGVLREASF